MAFTIVVAYPIAAILDKVLGEENFGIMSKGKMKKFFLNQETLKVLDPAERKILTAALELGRKQVDEVMTKFDEIYMLEINTVLSRKLLTDIYTNGYSRIPIYEDDRQNVVGILMAKDLILFNPEKGDIMTIKQMSSVMREIVCIDGSSSCEQVLKYFQKGESHIALIINIKNNELNLGDPYLEKVGLVTLEDIVEEILDEEIEDEFEANNENANAREERRLQKEQLVALFMERKAGKVLQKNEMKAVVEFLRCHVAPFNPNKLKTRVLEELVATSDIIEVESDSRPFSHKED